MTELIPATGPETGNEKIIQNSRSTQSQFPDQQDLLHNKFHRKAPETLTFTQNVLPKDHVSLTENPDRVLHPVSFVSLGPGDPELITLKALKILRQADIIYCPATAPPSPAVAGANLQGRLQGKGKSSGSASRAAQILRELGIDLSRISAFPLPMSKERNAALQAYDRVYEQAAQNYREAKKIVIVAEGDAGFYSSVQYIYDKFIENGIPVQRTAGVPAFIAAGALAGIHIVKQEEPLLVVPGILDCAALLQSLEQGVHTVIMKLSQSEAAVKECMRRAPDYGWHYFENVGTDGEFYTDSLETILARRFPYFSLMIILPEKRNIFQEKE